MASYRLYCLSADGHIGFADWIEAEDDPTALEHAREMKNGARRCEVWGGDRLIASLSHDELNPRLNSPHQPHP